MDLRQYLEIRRCFNDVRRDASSSSRIIFDEFAILCMLHEQRGLSATEIARAQNISCPTMTHRGNHLSQLGYLSRTANATDKRRLKNTLTRKGSAYVNRVIDNIMTHSDPEVGLAEMAPVDVMRLVAKAGSLTMPADMLVLLCFAVKEARALPIAQIVDITSLLQPTVSMAVLRLEGLDYIERGLSTSPSGRRPTRRNSGCVLTDAGAAAAQETVQRVLEA